MLTQALTAYNLNFMSEHNELGKQGEEVAQAYLKRNNYKIRHCNWFFQKAELDIVAYKDEWIVVVEVKARNAFAIERPQDAVTKSKQKRIVKAADAYIQEFNIDKECRFDIISVIFHNGKAEIEHLEDAFGPLL